MNPPPPNLDVYLNSDKMPVESVVWSISLLCANISVPDLIIYYVSYYRGRKPGSGHLSTIFLQQFMHLLLFQDKNIT